MHTHSKAKFWSLQYLKGHWHLSFIHCVISLVIFLLLFPSVEWLTAHLFAMGPVWSKNATLYQPHKSERAPRPGTWKKSRQKLVKVLTKGIPFVAKIFGGENGCERLEVRLDLCNNYTDPGGILLCQGQPSGWEGPEHSTNQMISAMTKERKKQGPQQYPPKERKSPLIDEKGVEGNWQPCLFQHHLWKARVSSLLPPCPHAFLSYQTHFPPASPGWKWIKIKLHGTNNPIYISYPHTLQKSVRIWVPKSQTQPPRIRLKTKMTFLKFIFCQALCCWL